MKTVTTIPPRRPTGAKPQSQEPELQVQPTPRARSILWRPADAKSLDAGEPPVFVTQGALREVSRHIWTAPEQEVLGFFLGERRQGPDGETRWTVVNATTRSSFIIPEEGEAQLPEDACHAAFLEAKRRGLELLGWYHSTPFIGDAPTARDMGTHRAYFREHWHAGLLVAPAAERPVGGFFRADLDRPDEGVFIPFYELVDDDGLLADGRKRTITPWQNYTTDDALQRTTVAAVARPKLGTGQIPVLMPKGRPDAAAAGLVGKIRKAKPRTMSKRKLRERRNRMLMLAGTAVVTAVAVGGAMLMILRK